MSFHTSSSSAATELVSLVGGLGTHLNFLPWMRWIILTLCNLCRTYYPHGLLHRGVNNARWAALPNNTDAATGITVDRPVDTRHMFIEDRDSGLVQAQKTANNMMHKSVCEEVQRFEDLFYLSIGGRQGTIARSFIDPVTFMPTSTLREMIDSITSKYGRPMSNDIDQLMHQLQSQLQYNSADHFETHCANFADIITRLKDTENAVGKHFQFKFMNASIEHHANIAETIKRYEIEKPLIDDRTLVEQNSRVLLGLRNAIPTISTLSGSYAHSAVTSPLASVTLPSVTADVDAAFAAGFQAGQSTAQSSRTRQSRNRQPNVAPYIAPAQMPPFTTIASPLYCYFHGDTSNFVNPISRHNGRNCNTMARQPSYTSEMKRATFPTDRLPIGCPPGKR